MTPTSTPAPYANSFTVLPLWASPCPSPSFLTTPVIKNVGWSGILPSPLASSFFSCRLIPPISTSSSGFGSSSENSASIRSTTTTSPSSNRPSPLALPKPTPGAVANSVGICWRGLRLDEDIGSGSEVNRVIGEVLAEGLPSIDASHDDLTGSEQGPEQHGSGLGGGQHGLSFDPPLKLLMEPFDRVGGPRAFPLAGRQSGKGEEPVTGLLEAG